MSGTVRCDGCGGTADRLVEVTDPDGLITTCEGCEDTMRSEIVRTVRSYV